MEWIGTRHVIEDDLHKNMTLALPLVGTLWVMEGYGKVVNTLNCAGTTAEVLDNTAKITLLGMQL